MDEAHEAHEAHEGRECLFAPQGASSETLEFIEEALDLMAFFVESPLYWRNDSATGIGPDLSGCTEFISNEGAQRISLICGVGDDVAGALQTRQERLCLRSIAILSRRQMNA